MRKGIADFVLEAAFVFLFLSGEGGLLGQAFCGLDSATGCSSPNPVLSLTALHFSGTLKAVDIKLVSMPSTKWTKQAAY